MPRNPELTPEPPPERALRTVKGARLALARLYHELRRGAVEPQVAGKLSHILSILISSARDHEVEARLAAIETKLGTVKPNGHARPEAHP